MSCGPAQGFAASPIGNLEDVQNRSMLELRTMSEVIAFLRSACSAETFEVVRKPLERFQRQLGRVERLSSENELFRKEFERLNLEIIRLQEELLKSTRSSDENMLAERTGIAEDMYNILMENVRRGGGETSLKEIFDEMRRKIDELEGEKRIWVKKFKILGERILQLETDIAILNNQLECILDNREGESQVLREPDGLINVDGCGDCGLTQPGNDSKVGKSVSFGRNAQKKLDFGTDDHLSPLAGSSGKFPVKEDGVLQGEYNSSDAGDGSTPIVEIIESDDDCSGPSRKLSGDEYRGRRNDEKGNKELKRKRGLVSSVFDEPFTQTPWGLSAALKKCEQKNIKEKDSVNSLSKSTVVNPVKHENGAGSASAKSDDGSSLHKERWKYEADMLFDISEDDELCMRAVCAIYRWQRSKSVERSTSQGFNGLLSPSETSLAEFLTGGDPEGKLKKSVMDLRDHCPERLSDCRSIATEHFKQLFMIYRQKEDPFFPSS